MAKLKDDPAVQDLLMKEHAKVEAAVIKNAKAATKDMAAKAKAIVENHVSDAKLAGNKDAAARLKAMGGDLVALVKG